MSITRTWTIDDPVKGDQKIDFTKFGIFKHIEGELEIIARGNTIRLPWGHPIFQMSDILQTMVERLSGENRPLRVDVNPFSLQVLVDYAECRKAVAVNREAEKLLKGLTEHILGSHTLLWAAQQIKLNLD